MTDQTIKPMRFLRLPQVQKITGLSRSSIYLMMASKQFPKQISLSGNRSVAWIEQEIETWMNSRIDASRNDPS